MASALSLEETDAAILAGKFAKPGNVAAKPAGKRGSCGHFAALLENFANILPIDATSIEIFAAFLATFAAIRCYVAAFF